MNDSVVRPLLQADIIHEQGDLVILVQALPKRLFQGGVAEAREKLVRHDVMSHVYAYGQQCPGAEAIIHLGATS